jgi:hypothetical protein
MGACLSIMGTGLSSFVGTGLTAVLGTFTFCAGCVGSIGGTVVGCFSSICTFCMCCTRTTDQAAMLPVTQWDDSRAKRAGCPICVLACLLSVLTVFLCASILMYIGMFFFYEVVFEAEDLYDNLHVGSTRVQNDLGEFHASQ